MEKQHGGKREGAGRKPKTSEIELIERLSPLDDVAMKKLEQGVKSGDFAYLKLFFEYRYSKPKQTVENVGDDKKLIVEIVRTKGQAGVT